MNMITDLTDMYPAVYLGRKGTHNFNDILVGK